MIIAPSIGSALIPIGSALTPISRLFVAPHHMHRIEVATGITMLLG